MRNICRGLLLGQVFEAKQRLLMQAGRPLSACFFQISSRCVLPVRRKGLDTCMATSTVNREFVEAVAAEMASGIHAAVECWMATIDQVLQSRNLTTLGRLQAVQEIVTEFKRLSGKTELECRRSATA